MSEPLTRPDVRPQLPRAIDPLPDLTPAEEAFFRRLKRDLMRGRVYSFEITLSRDRQIHARETTHFTPV